MPDALDPSQEARIRLPATAVLAAISLSHFLNDTLQSLLPAMYPLLKTGFRLDFAQVGLITFVFQVTASLLQPLVGLYTDRRPSPLTLPFGMTASLFGLLLLAVAPTFGVLLVAASLVGFGSSVFHPEASRVARMASGGRHGLAQSLFQVGGNFGSAIGPLLAALIVVPNGQRSIAFFSVLALIAILVLWRVSGWYERQRRQPSVAHVDTRPRLPKRRVASALVLLALLVFSKYFYTASFTSYYTFYLIHRFGVSVTIAQLFLFLFLASFALGTVVGGALGDRFGRKYVIVGSIFGALPFSLLLPHVGLFWTAALTVVIGLVISSAFSAILVFGQELMPGRVGAVSGLFFGFAFGMGGLGAATLGRLADVRGIVFVYDVCAFLPAIGAVAVFLPDLGSDRPTSSTPPTPGSTAFASRRPSV